MPIRVGIADDNLEFCKLLEEFFETTPEIEVVATFHNGLDVVNELPTKDIDVLLLDIIMPQMDGLGVLQWLKEKQQRQGLKIIIFSAFAQEDIARNSVDLGANYYILKPFDLHILTKRIIEIAGSSRPVMLSQDNSVGFSIESEVNRILESLQIPTHFKGYTYLRDAILLVVEEPTIINEIMKKLYPIIAEKYQTTMHRVERSMRFAIETAWSKGNLRTLHDLFGYCVDDRKGKPTNASFIAKIADKLRMERKIKLV